MSGLSGVGKTLHHLQDFVKELPSLFSHASTKSLLARSVLNYFSSVTCGLSLLQHAMWSEDTHQASSEIDIESFRRWVDEGDVHVYAKEIRSVLAIGSESRASFNSRLVYGAKL